MKNSGIDYSPPQGLYDAIPDAIPLGGEIGTQALSGIRFMAFGARLRGIEEQGRATRRTTLLTRLLCQDGGTFCGQAL